jgi:hypothetical protein
LKALFVGGGAKIVAATVATVAATSVITTTPAVRHDLVQLLAPAPHSAPAKAKRPTTHPVRAAVPAVVEATRARSGPAQPPLVLPAARRPASGLIVHKQHLVPHPAAAKKAAAPRPPTPAAAVQPINQTSAPDLRHSAPAVPAGRVATEDHGKGKTDQAEPVATPPTHAAPAAKHGHGSKLDAAAVAAVPAATVDQPAKTAPPTDKNHVAKAGGKSHNQVTAVPVPLTNKDPSGKADGKSHGQDTAAPPTDTQDPAAAVATDGQPPAQGAKHDH